MYAMGISDLAIQGGLRVRKTTSSELDQKLAAMAFWPSLRICRRPQAA